MELYDMHSHILPAFDDGAKTVEDSLELIGHLRRQGVRHICLTPHFYTYDLSYDDYLVKREKAFQKFLPHIPEDISVVLGCEVYVTEYLFNNSDIAGVAYGNSRYILTEFPYELTLDDRTMQQFYMLTQKYRLTPVMPHIERYPYFIDHPEAIGTLKDMGAVIQTNISNYVKGAPLFRKRKLLKLIERGFIDILGSDTHSMHHNPPDVFAEAVDTIGKKCGADTVERMMATAGKIFRRAQEPRT